MRKRLLAAGYFGCGNVGDDAILLAFRNAAEAAGYEVSALSGAPERTLRDLGIRSYPRKEMGSVKQAISEHDALVFCGGSIFQDVSSVKSVLYYKGLVSMAKSAKRPVIMVGQGIGPLGTMFGKRWALQAFNAADAIAVRDEESARLLHQLGYKRPVKTTADMAFLLDQPIAGEESPFQIGEMKMVGIAPRPHGKVEDIVKTFGEITRALHQAGYLPVLIEMDSELDKPILDKIEKAQGGKIPSVRKISSPTDLQRRFKRMEAVIAMRLHAGILAAVAEVPSLMISYDPKVSSFASQAGLKALNMNQLNPKLVVDSLTSMLADRETAVSRLIAKTAQLRTAAQINIDVISEALGR